MPNLSCALRALVPQVPRALRPVVPHVIRALCALVPYVSHALRASRDPRAIMIHVPHMSYMLSC